MRRIHLFEIEDQPWCSAPIRDAGTDFLQFALKTGKNYAPVGPFLNGVLARLGERRVVDMGSGGGGPWLGLAGDVDAEVTLTDRYPNLEAFRRAQEQTGGRLRFHPEPVDAARMPAELRGFRTMFTAFHHSRPEAARAILADAVRNGQGIGIFETTERSGRCIAATLFSPLILLLATPFIRPFRWSRLPWTYLVPLVPALVLWDGIVSCLRSYTPEEMRALAEGLDGFDWEAGQLTGHAPIPVTYLVGTPRA
jgi:hypothetical protein